MYAYPMIGDHPAAVELVNDTKEYQDADCIQLDGRYRVDRVYPNGTYRTYVLDGDGVWQRTRKFPIETKDEAVNEILKLRIMNNGG